MEDDDDKNDVNDDYQEDVNSVERCLIELKK